MKISITESIEDLDFTLPKVLYNKLQQLKAISKGLNKEHKEEITFLKTKAQQIKRDYRSCLFKKWRLTASSKKYKKYFEYDHYPTAKDIKHLKDSFKQSIKTFRSNLKKESKEQKNLLGFEYATYGGVFLAPKSILNIQAASKPEERIRKSKKPHDKIKANYVGLELELFAELGREELNKEFIKAGLAGTVYIKDDGSIRTEISSQKAHEVTALFREEYTAETVKKICAVLNSLRVKGSVNNSCGLHVHLDARNRNPEVMYYNFVSSLPMLKNMVPNCRVTNSQYCAINNSKVMASSPHPTGGSTRYQAVNPESYSKYKTVEIRLHSGSINATKIINWIKILTTIANHPTKLENDITSAYEFSAMFPEVNSKLIEYINKRTALFNGVEKDLVDTRADHFWLNEYEVAI